MSDLRVTKTQNAIKQAFIKELAKKDINQIRITKLCEKAMVNKSTFYKHYTDIEDLLNKMQDEMIDQLFEDFADKDKLFSDPILFMNGIREVFSLREKELITLFKKRLPTFASKFESKMTNIYVDQNDSLERRVALEFTLSGLFRTIGKARHDNAELGQIFDILTKLITKIQIDPPTCI